MQERRAAFVRPAVALLLVAVAFALWLRLPFFSEDPLDVCPGYVAAERTGYSISHALWPPGATECEWTRPVGAVRHSTYVPWSEWLIMALPLPPASVAAGVAWRWGRA